MPTTASAATVDLTKPSYGTVEFWVEIEVRAIATDGFAPVPWTTECPALAGPDCRIAGQDGRFNIPVNHATLHAEFRDVEAPRLPVVLPPGSGLLEGTVTLRASAQDNLGVAGIEFMAGATSLGTATGPPFEVSFDSARFPDGDLAATARAFDAAGNTAESPATTLHLDNRPPAVTVTGPGLDPGSADASPSFTFTYDDAICKQCGLDDAAVTACDSPIAFKGLADGVHTLRIHVSDALGHVRKHPHEFRIAAVRGARRRRSPPWTVVLDADGDGFTRDIDCDDANPAINPGALDVAGNLVDEDRKDGPARLAAVRANPRVSWSYHGRRLRIVAFVIADAEPGTRVELRCSGRVCPFRLKRSLATRSGRVVMTQTFKRRWLAPGTRLTVTLEKPGAIGRRFELTVAADGHGLTRVERWLAPRTRRVVAC